MFDEIYYIINTYIETFEFEEIAFMTIIVMVLFVFNGVKKIFSI